MSALVTLRANCTTRKNVEEFNLSYDPTAEVDMSPAHWDHAASRLVYAKIHGVRSVK